MTRTDDVEHPDCVDVREALSRAEPLSPSLETHLAHCPLCSALGQESAVTVPEDALFSAVQAAVSRETGLTAKLRSLPTRTRLLAAALWAASLVAAVAITLPRGAHGPVPVARVVLVVTVLAALVAVVLRMVLRPLQSPPPSRRELGAAFVAGLLVPAVFALLPGSRHVDAVAGLSDRAAATGCFIVGFLPGALVLLSLWAFDRGAHRSRSTALLAAVVGGLVGNAALELHCPITAPVHLLLGHATLGFALVFLYAVFTVRRSRPA